MLKRTQLILLFMLVFSGAVLLGNAPVGAQETSEFTYVSVNNGQFEASIDGGVPRDPCYYEPSVGECVPMVKVVEFYICNGSPAPDLGNCRRFNYGNICFAANQGECWGGDGCWFNLCFVYPPACVPSH